MVRDGEDIDWWDIVVISRRHTPYITFCTSCFVAITVRWAMLQVRFNPDFDVVCIAHPTMNNLEAVDKNLF